MSNEKVIQICEPECANPERVIYNVGDKIFVWCCKEGRDKSRDELNKAVEKTNNDLFRSKKRNMEICQCNVM